MIIYSLELNNFRQFIGKQTISFSTDLRKKVTIIIAESGAGKTSIIQSFKWIFYGICKYKSPLNTSIKQKMHSNEETEISGSISLLHNNQEYIISRIQIFKKGNTNIQGLESKLFINIKDDATGISKQLKGREADRIIKEIMPEDLFPYFFLEGENLIKVGEQMSKGKSGMNNEFVKAIRGLLGFNYLYEAEKHLKAVSISYQDEISKSTVDDKLTIINSKIREYEEKIEKCGNEIKKFEAAIDYNIGKYEECNKKIIENGEIEEKQKRTKQIEQELKDLIDKTNDQKKYIFKKFSSQSIYFVMNALLPIAEETLKKTDCLDQGIPGINVEAVQYLLNKHVCICGNKICEGSKEYSKLDNLIKFLPPNNIGYEIERFNVESKTIRINSANFNEDFSKARKDLDDFIERYNNAVEEQDRLNEKIGSVDEDIAALKQLEKDYKSKIKDGNENKIKNEISKEDSQKEKDRLIDEQKEYIQTGEKNYKFRLFFDESEHLKDKISDYCKRKEIEKRESLEKAINEIFRDFYEEKIQFYLDSNYVIQIKTFDNELSEDFTSGGQDVAVALAFIGAIIKLNQEKDLDPDNIIEEETKETYPLVMDAPTSNFGMKQMYSFSEMMPKITDQVIVFINDKDGPILKSRMVDQIGSEWCIIKEESYYSKIEEVK